MVVHDPGEPLAVSAQCNVRNCRRPVVDRRRSDALWNRLAPRPPAQAGFRATPALKWRPLGGSRLSAVGIRGRGVRRRLVDPEVSDRGADTTQRSLGGTGRGCADWNRTSMPFRLFRIPWLTRKDGVTMTAKKTGANAHASSKAHKPAAGSKSVSKPSAKSPAKSMTSATGRATQIAKVARSKARTATPTRMKTLDLATVLSADRLTISRGRAAESSCRRRGSALSAGTPASSHAEASPDSSPSPKTRPACPANRLPTC